MKLFPDYPRDSKRLIPEEMIFDVIRIFPEWGGHYLWDMNGVSSTVGSITGDDSDPWDDFFESWQDIYENKPLTDNADPQWDSQEEYEKFRSHGLKLAKRLFDFFDHKRTVIYYDLDRTPTRFDAMGKPPIRLTDQE